MGTHSNKRIWETFHLMYQVIKKSLGYSIYFFFQGALITKRVLWHAVSGGDTFPCLRAQVSSCSAVSQPCEIYFSGHGRQHFSLRQPQTATVCPGGRAALSTLPHFLHTWLFQVQPDPVSSFLLSFPFPLYPSEVKVGSKSLFLAWAALHFSFRSIWSDVFFFLFLLLMLNDPLPLSCALAFWKGDEAETVGGVWQNTSKVCVNSTGYQLWVGISSCKRVCHICRNWRWILVEFRGMSECHVLCVMLERISENMARWCCLPFSELLVDFKMVTSDPAPTTLLWTFTCDRQESGPEVQVYRKKARSW